MAGRKPGTPKTGGRVAGTPNKTTALMKAAIESVYNRLQDESGAEHGHFLNWAKGEPGEFYKLASKLLPLQVGGDPDGVPVATRNMDLASAPDEVVRWLAAQRLSNGDSSTTH